MMGPRPQPPRSYLENHRAAFERARLLVRLFYGLTAVEVSRALESWPRWRAETEWDPLWAVTWFDPVGMETGVAITIVMLAVGVFGSLLAPGARPFRILAFVGLLLYGSLANSFGKINHGIHPFIYISFLFVLLPSGRASEKNPPRAFRQQYLLVFWAAQSSMLMLYTLSGLWKLYGGVMQFLVGQVGNFHIRGMAYQIADRLMQDHGTSMLGPFLIERPVLGWFLLLGGIYLELCSFWIAFRPRLHRLWGVALMCLHLGNVLVLTIAFPGFILLLALLFLASPFQWTRSSPGELLANLPFLSLRYRPGASSGT